MFAFHIRFETRFRKNRDGFFNFKKNTKMALTGSLEQNKDDGQRKAKQQFNSLDFVVSVDRLPVVKSTAQGIYHYGYDNNYPRKITQSAMRCSSLVTVMNKQSQFIQGLGFAGATAADVKNGTAIKINSQGDTLYSLLQFCAQEKSNINIAIHVNYNALGEAVEFTPIQYDFVRRKIRKQGEKFERFIIADIWHTEFNYQNGYFGSKVVEFNKWVENKKTSLSFEALECFAYNPDPTIVREQIEICGGIENYSGQLFYKNRSREVYQKAIYDSLADKFQFLAECDLASLSNVQNGYAMSGIFKYPNSINDSYELAEMKRKTANMTGAINTGRVLYVPVNSTENVPQNMFEPTAMQNIDKLYEKQNERAENGIQSFFSTPTSLIGKDTTGNFATQNMQEAFDAYNSVTEPLRQELEIELTELISNSIFASQVQLPIEIEPLKYVSRIETTETTETNENINQ